MIDNKDITFACTGLIFKDGPFSTKKSLHSIRKFYQGSKIILSTWKDEDVSGLEGLYDELIVNDGRMDREYSTCLPECDWYPKINSYNLQQRSVSAALNKCTTKYFARFRTDFVLTGRCFVKNYEEGLRLFYMRTQGNIAFEQKVLIHSMGTINPLQSNLPMAHHPSDVLHFGLASDIKKIWTGHAMPDDISNFFTNNRNRFNNPCLFNHLFTPEQYVWLKTLDAAGISYDRPEYYLDLGAYIVDRTKKLFEDNFIVLGRKELGIASKFDSKLRSSVERFCNSDTMLKWYCEMYPLSKGSKYLLKFRNSVDRAKRRLAELAAPALCLYRWTNSLLSLIASCVNIPARYLRYLHHAERYGQTHA
jgi:hypothetical protein